MSDTPNLRRDRIEAGADRLQELYDALVLDGGPSGDYFVTMAEGCIDAADALLPSYDGFDALRAFRSAYNAWAEKFGVPITNDLPQDVAMCQAAGVEAVVALLKHGRRGYE